MEFVRRWLYIQKNSDIKGLIVDNQKDYDLLISQGYKSSPKDFKEEDTEVKENISVSELHKEPLPVKEEVIKSVSELNKLDDFEEDLDLMTKEQLVDFAKENFKKELKVRDTKVSLINKIKEFKEV